MTNLTARYTPLEIKYDGSLTIGGFEFEPSGNFKATQTATIESAEHAIRFFEAITSFGAIARGLLANWIVKQNGTTYEQIAERVGIGIDTLYKEASVMRHIAPTNIRAGLTFTDYAVTASLDLEEQTKWIDRRLSGEISSARQLAAMIHGELPHDETGETINECPVCKSKLQIADNRIVGVL